MRNKEIKISRKYFQGDNLPGKISEGHVVRPNLYKMTSTELQKWKRFVNQFSRRYIDYNANLEVCNEFIRIRNFIYLREKEVVLTDKDFVEMIKRKRGIQKDICIESVALCCQTGKVGNEIAVEYY